MIKKTSLLFFCEIKRLSAMKLKTFTLKYIVIEKQYNIENLQNGYFVSFAPLKDYSQKYRLKNFLPILKKKLIKEKSSF